MCMNSGQKYRSWRLLSCAHARLFASMLCARAHTPLQRRSGEEEGTGTDLSCNQYVLILQPAIHWAHYYFRLGTYRMNAKLYSAGRH